MTTTTAAQTNKKQTQNKTLKSQTQNQMKKIKHIKLLRIFSGAIKWPIAFRSPWLKIYLRT